MERKQCRLFLEMERKHSKLFLEMERKQCKLFLEVERKQWIFFFFFSTSATARMVKKLCELFLLNRSLYRDGEGTECVSYFF